MKCTNFEQRQREAVKRAESRKIAGERLAQLRGIQNRQEEAWRVQVGGAAQWGELQARYAQAQSAWHEGAMHGMCNAYPQMCGVEQDAVIQAAPKVKPWWKFW